MAKKLVPLSVASCDTNEYGFRAACRDSALGKQRYAIDITCQASVLPPAGAREKKGKTSVLSAEEMRALLDSININELLGLRDRTLIALMGYTFARVVGDMNALTR